MLLRSSIDKLRIIIFAPTYSSWYENLLVDYTRSLARRYAQNKNYPQHSIYPWEKISLRRFSSSPERDALCALILLIPRLLTLIDIRVWSSLSCSSTRRDHHRQDVPRWHYRLFENSCQSASTYFPGPRWWFQQTLGWCHARCHPRLTSSDCHRGLCFSTTEFAAIKQPNLQPLKLRYCMPSFSRIASQREREREHSCCRRDDAIGDVKVR